MHLGRHAEIPANVYDAVAKGDTSEERWWHSRILLRQSVDTATWQAVNRVRDPEGKVESRVYFIGCRLDQVRQVAMWGTNRRVIVKDTKETRGRDESIILTPVMEVGLSQGNGAPDRRPAPAAHQRRGDHRCLSD